MSEERTPLYTFHTRAFKDRWPQGSYPTDADRYDSEDYERYVVDAAVDGMKALRIDERVGGLVEEFDCTPEVALQMLNITTLLSIRQDLHHIARLLEDR